jgi:hypothetical protein
MNPTATPRVQHKRANHTGMVTMKVCFGFMLQDYATRCPGRYCAWVGFSVAATEVIGAPSFEVEFRNKLVPPEGVARRSLLNSAERDGQRAENDR